MLQAGEAQVQRPRGRATPESAEERAVRVEQWEWQRGDGEAAGDLMVMTIRVETVWMSMQEGAQGQASTGDLMSGGWGGVACYAGHCIPWSPPRLVLL
jgi:hypothetical protein